MLERIVATAVVALLATYSRVRYSRLNTSYDRSRPSVPSDRLFQQIYNLIVPFAMVVAAAAFWSNAPLLGKIHEPTWLRTSGLLVSVAGAVLFELAIRALGSQSSICVPLGLSVACSKACRSETARAGC